MPRLASRPGLDYPSKAQLTCTIRAIQVAEIYGLVETVETKYAKGPSINLVKRQLRGRRGSRLLILR